MRKAITAGLIVLATILSACNDADVASNNISQAADQFEILRRVIFYNGITEEYMLVIEGYCSLGNYDEYGELTVTCKTGPNEFKKHFLGLSDNVTYFVEQLEGAGVSTSHYRIIFKPSVIVPDIDLEQMIISRPVLTYIAEEVYRQRDDARYVAMLEWLEKQNHEPA